jgi:dihydroorotase
VDYLKDAVKRGVVDNIGTDHAPHTRAEKERDMLEAPFGIANIEVTFPLLYSELVKSNTISMQQLFRLLQTGPASVMGWTKPSLEKGDVADITILDLNNTRVVQAAQFKTKAKFSPWEGQALSGWPVATFVRGKQVFASKDKIHM